MVDNGVNLRIGRRQDAVMPFIGKIDEAQVYDRALTAQEIQTLYNGPVLPPPDPSVFGEMALPFSMPDVAVDISLLHTGEVIFWKGQNNGTSTPTNVYLWNPVTQVFTQVTNALTNIFCAGHAILADGRLFVAGGHDNGSGILGEDDANIFDPISRTWSPAAKMAYKRWYPSVTTLADGKMLVTSGGIDSFTNIAGVPEIYDPANNSWTQLNNADLDIPFYPYTFLLPSGKIVDAGSDEHPYETKVLDINTQTWTTIDPNVVDGGSAVMYAPGKIMKSGTAIANPNSGVLTAATTYVIDMNQPNPVWRQTAPMNNPRGFHTLTLLPDGSVLASGGSKMATNQNLSQAVFELEVWSPVTETWTKMASIKNPRFYHSSALLLPDGKVLISGSGNSSGVNQLNGEIYSPAYLFKGPRPTITSAPTTITYNSLFSVSSPNASNISKVTLMRPGSMTHTINYSQSILDLPFSVNGNNLDVQAPLDGNYAAPGYYMLFIIDNQGVPSVASFVKI